MHEHNKAQYTAGCPECQAYAREKARRWRANKGEQHRKYMETRRRNGIAFLALLKDVPCLDCNNRYPHYVMEFDHVRGQKQFTISQHPRDSHKTLLAEVKKCDIVCANCHRIRTHNRR